MTLARTGEEALRRRIVETAQTMSRQGLSPGRSGNISARFGDGMLITPSGVAYAEMTAADICRVGAGGEPVGGGKPSSETPFHCALYARHGRAGAIVHCHSPAATALACAHRPIPAFHYMVAVAGAKEIPLAPYALPGTEALARHCVEALKQCRACLLANHGQVALGPDLASALELAGEVETLAREYVDVLTLGGPRLLSDAEMDEVLAHFERYRAAGG